MTAGWIKCGWTTIGDVAGPKTTCLHGIGPGAARISWGWGLALASGTGVPLTPAKRATKVNV